MTAVQKGAANEKRTAKWLSDRGYLVHTVQRQGRSFRYDKEKKKVVPIFRKNQNNDLFNLFDHIAVINDVTKLDIIQHPIILVQTKSKKIYGKELQEFLDFPYPHCYIFVWEKKANGRYGEPIIQDITKIKIEKVNLWYQ